MVLARADGALAVVMVWLLGVFLVIPMRIRHSDWLEFLAPLNLWILLRHNSRKKCPIDVR